MENVEPTQPEKKVIGRPFAEGNPGRPAGSKNKKTIMRMAVVMALADFHPADELMKLAQSTQSESLKYDILRFLASFVEAPQNVPKPLSHDTPEGSVEEAKKMNEQLADLCAPLSPKLNGDHKP